MNHLESDIIFSPHRSGLLSFGVRRESPTPDQVHQKSCGNGKSWEFFMHDHYQGHMGHITLMLTTTTRLGAGMGNLSVCTPSSRDASATLKSDSQKRSHWRSFPWWQLFRRNDSRIPPSVAHGQGGEAICASSLLVLLHLAPLAKSGRWHTQAITKNARTAQPHAASIVSFHDDLGTLFVTGFTLHCHHT